MYSFKGVQGEFLVATKFFQVSCHFSMIFIKFFKIPWYFQVFQCTLIFPGFPGRVGTLVTITYNYQTTKSFKLRKACDIVLSIWPLTDHQNKLILNNQPGLVDDLHFLTTIWRFPREWEFFIWSWTWSALFQQGVHGWKVVRWDGVHFLSVNCTKIGR